MKHIIFSENEKYKTALLFKSNAFNKAEIVENYIGTLSFNGVSADDVIAFTLEADENGKISAKFAKDYLNTLLPVLNDLGVSHLYVTESTYFKTLTKQSKAEPHIGYVMDCKYPGYGHMKVVYGINYRQLIYNPALQPKLYTSVQTLSDSLQDSYVPVGSGIIHSAQYPSDYDSILAALRSLMDYPELKADIEAFSLDFNKAGIASISFAWNKNNGIAFLCDYEPVSLPNLEGHFGKYTINPTIRALLKDFFESYQGKLTWHNANYDLKVLIYSLWMKDSLDMVGLLTGLNVLTKNLDDTKIIAYLATNSTAGNNLKLKELAQPFAGNWAMGDITDVRRIPPQELLQYNLVDSLSTCYVEEKYWPVLVQDNQESIYRTIMLPSIKTILQMELCGMPLSMLKVTEVKEKLLKIQESHLAVLTDSPTIKTVNLILQTNAMEAANAKLKTKQHTLDKWAGTTFNPNSGPQMQILLYEHLGLPVIDYTDTKQPATGAETLEKLVNHTDDPKIKAILEALVGYGKVSKILSTFIPAFERSLLKGDGWHYLHGSFNLGGTVSGRLSSSSPNLQNLPANSIYGKLIKECFEAPSGWLFAGADFNSLEDMISALTTKDKNKIRVYTQGFDGHSLRAAYYYREELSHINLEDPNSVNSIKKDYPEFRQDSKAPTFLLTYGGTFHGMMSNLGWTREKSQAIESNYHILYKESDDYIANRLVQAAKDGFVEVAFGLRVRTPLLKQVVYGSKSVPFEAKTEGRTAGNAMGQSYGQLNNRAVNAFMEVVWNSPYRYDIKPVALVHDAIYIMFKDNPLVAEFANRELIKAMQWQELPEIAHEQVKLGAALDIFWPTWANAIGLPNGATAVEIVQACTKGKQKYLNSLIKES